MSRSIRHFVVPAVILLIGLLGASLLVLARKTPERAERPVLGPLVEVMDVTSGDVDVTVTAHGEVVPKVAVNVVPQVSGEVVQVHPSLVAGGFFAAGEPLVVIDPRDYELAVARAEATVARAQVALEQEEAEAEVARQEWHALNPGEEAPSGLVVREPQVRQAQAELQSALADLESARLNLERTRVSVPFDGVVVSKQVDVGQFVATGSSIATVYGTRMVEVRVPMESRELAWFSVPGNGGGTGAKATLTGTFGGVDYRWAGRVDRMEAELDPASRMVTVVVQVDSPYATGNGQPPLLPGSFVDVSINGRTAADVVALPRHAVHEGDTVWTVRDHTLQIRTVDIARADRFQVLVSGGLDGAGQVVVSSLDAVTDGMTVRPVAVAEDAGGDA